jgi:hypothetical protein
VNSGEVVKRERKLELDTRSVDKEGYGKKNKGLGCGILVEKNKHGSELKFLVEQIGMGSS